jgi:hypothetical protein
MNFAEIWASLQGKKTYLLAGITLFIAFLGHVFGPMTINGGVVIPKYSWFNLYQIATNCGLFACLRHGIQTLGEQLLSPQK